MKKFFIFLIFVLSSCTIRQTRPDIIGYICDSISLQPIPNTEIKEWNGVDKGYINVSVTDSFGYFKIGKKTKVDKLLGDRRNLGLKYQIKNDLYVDKEIVLFNENDVLNIGTIYLYPKEKIE